MTLTHCSMSGNTAGDGGGVVNDAVLTLINTTLSGNTTLGGGVLWRSAKEDVTLRH